MNWRETMNFSIYKTSDNSDKSTPLRTETPTSVTSVTGSTDIENFEVAEAISLLNAVGARVLHLDGSLRIGLWSDLDSAEVRAALRLIGADELSVCYLDGGGIPDRYKARGVCGEPIPKCVLDAMQQQPEQPWSTRDRLLKEMHWRYTKPMGAERARR